MSLIVDLSPELEARVEKEAERQGIAPAEVVRKLVEETLRPLTGAEWLAVLRQEDALGAFQDRPDDWARQLRDESNRVGC